MLWAPCDKWVCDFPHNFSGIIDGYGLQLQHVHSHCVRASSDFFYGHLATGRKSCMEAVSRSYGNHAVSAGSAWKSYGACVASIQRPHVDGAMTVGGPYDCLKSIQSSYHFFCPKMTILNLDFLTARSARCLYMLPTQCSYDMSMGCGLTIFSSMLLILIKQNHRGYSTRESVRKSYSLRLLLHGSRQPPHGGCTIMLRAGCRLGRLIASHM